MSKKIRNAVRTFLIKDNQVICIKYKTGNIGYIDIPGGKIEIGESAQNAAVRGFKEETGIEINDLEKLGNIIVEYSDRIYDMEVFKANKYSGSPQEFEENESFWIPIDDLLKEKNRYVITYLLLPEFQNEYKSKNINLKFLVDDNHRVIDYSSFKRKHIDSKLT